MLFVLSENLLFLTWLFFNFLRIVKTIRVQYYILRKRRPKNLVGNRKPIYGTPKWRRLWFIIILYYYYVKYIVVDDGKAGVAASVSRGFHHHSNLCSTGWDRILAQWRGGSGRARQRGCIESRFLIHSPPPTRLPTRPQAPVKYTQPAALVQAG